MLFSTTSEGERVGMLGAYTCRMKAHWEALLLQDRATGEFLSDEDQWVKAEGRARTFPAIEFAIGAAQSAANRHTQLIAVISSTRRLVFPLSRQPIEVCA